MSHTGEVQNLLTGVYDPEPSQCLPCELPSERVEKAKTLRPPPLTSTRTCSCFVDCVTSGGREESWLCQWLEALEGGDVCPSSCKHKVCKT